jgi:hypothetical protein
MREMCTASSNFLLLIMVLTWPIPTPRVSKDGKGNDPTCNKWHHDEDSAAHLATDETYVTRLERKHFWQTRCDDGALQANAYDG